MKQVLLALGLAAVLAACSTPDPNAVRASSAPQTVQQGTVVSTRAVTIAGTASTAGTVTGAVAGAALGSQIGGGSGQTVATTAGAAAGGVAANQATAARNQQAGVEVIVRLENGQQIAVTQPGNPGDFLAGDPVQVVSGGGSTTVRRVPR
ncbi:glycine zipper 2TM domain-containing protein [Rivibacter subsaxonicus]|uniref:Outer membrane lipoprotein SlyB n=1 Tax=Rivibacter subsaxonicus TaxID=457575 RepID=A0A4Q7VV26_9BURK|nr:glycine zipper 2TM domain-containing protein [Rivibacter subsaxonicus]RZU00504.1 outer membrane lipoprotein SlyB [Rivibacter subsaxonicus]